MVLRVKVIWVKRRGDWDGKGGGGGRMAKIFQPSFKNRSVSFVPKGGSGPCVFYPPRSARHLIPPMLFDQFKRDKLNS